MAPCTSNCNLQMSGRPSTLALKVVNIVFLMPTQLRHSCYSCHGSGGHGGGGHAHNVNIRVCKYNFSGANPLERYEVAQMHRLVVIEGVNVLRTCLYVELFPKKVFDKGGECELAHLHF